MLPLFIALLHGLPSVLGALLFRSKGIWIGAAIGIIVAFIWGRGYFLYSDLMGVCSGVLAGYFVMTKLDEMKAQRQKERS